MEIGGSPASVAGTQLIGPAGDSTAGHPLPFAVTCSMKMSRLLSLRSWGFIQICLEGHFLIYLVTDLISVALCSKAGNLTFWVSVLMPNVDMLYQLLG